MSDPVTCARCGAPLSEAAEPCARCLLAHAAERPGPRLGPGFLDDLPVPGEMVLIADKYTVLQVVARGGMGVVYKAQQENLNRIVAIKMLLGGVHAGEGFKRRFLQEAKAAARLNHPNIVSIHDWGEDAGQPFFSMDYVEGHTLAELARDQPLTPRVAAGIVQILANAMDYAHGQGVLHRDLKPSNVLVDASRNPRVTDFGLARQLDETTLLTGSGEMLGTPGYLPPEQLLGQRAEIGPHSDVYGLGAILYYLLTCRPPHVAGSVPEALRAVEESEPMPPRQLNPSVPPELETICLKCLEKEPQRRYATAQALAEDLTRWLNGEPIRARPVTLWGRAIKWRRRRPAVAALLGVILLLLVTAIAVVATLFGKVVASERRGQARLSQLQTMVPLLSADAQSLIQRGDFDQGLDRVKSILSLRPEGLEYTLLAANLHQTLFRFEEAAHLYEKVVERQPDHTRALESLEFCRRVEAARGPTNGEPASVLLLELHGLMTRQERYSEAFAVSRKLGDKRPDLFRQWKERLEEAGIVGPGSGRLKIEPDGRLELFADHAPIDNLAALKGMPFWRLHIPNTKITDLTPLRGMPLQSLDLGFLQVQNLNPLQGLPLTNLSLFGAIGLKDITPLAGCPLITLNLCHTEVTDLTSLRDSPLQALWIGNTAIEDLTPLKKLPLKVLDLEGATRIRDISPLADLPIEWLRLDGGIADLGPVQRMPLRQLSIRNCGVSNLAVLAATPLQSLRLSRTKRIDDLNQLEQVPLNKLELDECQLSDLQFVSQMPLESLRLIRTPVSDLAPLRRLPLRELFLDGTSPVDVSPLAECESLEVVILPRHARNIHRLRTLPRLHSIAYHDNGHTKHQPAADFWQRYEAPSAPTR